jgi:hypothetical protein
MQPTRNNSRELTLGTLEEIAVSVRDDFACMFSTADEYQAALIDKRRAEGRYDPPSHWPMIAFWGCSLAVACLVLLATV